MTNLAQLILISFLTNQSRLTLTSTRLTLESLLVHDWSQHRLCLVKAWHLCNINDNIKLSNYFQQSPSFALMETQHVIMQIKLRETEWFIRFYNNLSFILILHSREFPLRFSLCHLSSNYFLSISPSFSYKNLSFLFIYFKWHQSLPLWHQMEKTKYNEIVMYQMYWSICNVLWQPCINLIILKWSSIDASLIYTLVSIR